MSDLRPTATTRQRTLNFRLRLILKYGLLRGPAPRMASLTSKPPSKPVQALKFGVWFANVVLLYEEFCEMSRYVDGEILDCTPMHPCVKIGIGGEKDMDKSKKKEWIILGISGAAGGIVGYFGAAYLEKLGIGGLDWIFIFLGTILTLYAQIILHEVGHLICGLISGYKFVSFRVGSFILYKKQGKIHLGRYSIAGTAGQCLMTPPNLKEGKIPYQLYNFGGAIMNLAVAGIATILFALCNFGVFGGTICITLIMWGVLLLITNGIPMRLGGIDNDGYNALCLGENPEALRAFWIQLKVNEMLTGGMRLKDMPEDWFQQPDEEGMQNNMIAAIEAMRCNRLLDKMSFDEANRAIGEVVNYKNGMVGIQKMLLKADQIFCEILGERREEILNKMQDRELVNFMKSMKTYPGVIRTQYAYALLIKQDEKKAEQYKKQFEKIMEKHPHEGEVESEWELIKHCEQN